MQSVFKFLTKRIREGRDAVPRVKYTIFFLFSGHGFMKEGMQNFLLNEYDERQKSYKTISIEPQLRLLASMPNAYVIGLFVCGRQLYNKDAMTGFMPSETAETR